MCPLLPNRLQVGELDGSLERLKDRAAKLTKSAKKYRWARGMGMACSAEQLAAVVSICPGSASLQLACWIKPHHPVPACFRQPCSTPRAPAARFSQHHPQPPLPAPHPAHPMANGSGALDASALGTGAFAESLESFCGEADEESSVIGGPTLLKFVSTFREVGGSLLGETGEGRFGGTEEGSFG